MKKFSSVCMLSFLVLLLCFTACKKDKEHTGLTITLYNSPLSTIQLYIQGKWKLQYTIGGIAGSKYYPKHNTYMIVNANHITLQDDSAGIIKILQLFGKECSGLIHTRIQLISCLIFTNRDMGMHTTIL